MVTSPQIVIDTSVFIAAMRSQRGAAYRMLMLSDSGLFQANVSVPLVAEYEAVVKRMLDEISLTEKNVDDILDYICTVSNRRRIFFLWRPFLPDPGDDMVLEVAIAGSCQYIVTFNRRHFKGSEQFGIEVVTPREFLEKIGVLS